VSEANGSGAGGYLLFVWSPTGYSMREMTGEPPAIGSEFEDGDRTLVINKIGASPFPGDARTCAFSIGKV
jgi:hypothetical protein